MTNLSPAIVSKLWNYCSILRDNGLSCGGYVKQLTYLLFLKKAQFLIQHSIVNSFPFLGTI